MRRSRRRRQGPKAPLGQAATRAGRELVGVPVGPLQAALRQLLLPVEPTGVYDQQTADAVSTLMFEAGGAVVRVGASASVISLPIGVADGVRQAVAAVDTVVGGRTLTTPDPGTVGAWVAGVIRERQAAVPLAHRVRALQQAGKLTDEVSTAYESWLDATQALMDDLGRFIEETPEVRNPFSLALDSQDLNLDFALQQIRAPVPHFQTPPPTGLGVGPGFVLVFILILAVLFTVVLVTFITNEPARREQQRLLEDAQNRRQIAEAIITQAIAEGLSAAEIAELLNPIVEQLEPPPPAADDNFLLGAIVGGLAVGAVGWLTLSGSAPAERARASIKRVFRPAPATAEQVSGGRRHALPSGRGRVLLGGARKVAR